VRSRHSSTRLPRILAAYTVNRLGTWFGFVALSLAVFAHTHSALAVALLLVSGQALPAFLVPALVVRVEASSRRAKLAILYLIEALLTTALVVLLPHFWLPAVLVLVALDGTVALAASALLRAEAARTARGRVVAPAESSASPDRHSDDAQAAERKANAALNIAFSATFVLGPALAGVTVATAGASVALLIDVGSFLVCAAMLIDLHPSLEETHEASVRARLLAAWKHIGSVPSLRSLLIAQGVALVFFESAAPIEVPYAKVTLHAGDRGYGLLLAAWGAGVVVGSVIFARSARRSLGAMLSAGTLAVGLAYVGFSVAPSLDLACVAAAVGGVGNGVQWASLISAVQRLTPGPLLGRMMSAVESLGALCPAIGLSLGGILVALSSPRVAFLTTGLGAAATTVAFVRVSRSGLERTPDAITETSIVGGETAHVPAFPPQGPGGLQEAEASRGPTPRLHPASRTSQTP
jgi:MFS family permease